MGPSTIELTANKFATIHTDEKFRNQIAYAHGCLDQFHKFKHMKTCSYPYDYIVTEEQVSEAKGLIEVARVETLAKHMNDLLFVGMGMTYASRYEGDLCNHRIRTEFLNCEGHRYFVEFGTGLKCGDTRCDFSIDKEDHSTVNREGGNYGFAGLGSRSGSSLPKYTEKALLKLVNDTFNCAFERLIVDNYNIACDGVVCESLARKESAS